MLILFDILEDSLVRLKQFSAGKFNLDKYDSALKFIYKNVDQDHSFFVKPNR